MGTVYWIIRDFGSAAQAGFGVGSRVMQAIFLPAMAVAFAVPAIAGQNFGAKNSARVRETFFAAAVSSSVIMAIFTLLCQWQGQSLVHFFTNDAEVILVGQQYLQIISWNFVAIGLVFVCSGMFQAMGNTWPSLLSTASRLCVFVVAAVWISKQPGFQLPQVWYVSVATTTLQAVVSLLLVRVQLRKRLQFGDAPIAANA
jgi:Na+-driven multidrug efflux pump